MDKVEYLYFIPLLLYGIALNDLFVQFKLFLQPKFRYLPYVLTIIIFIEIIIFNVYEYYEFAKGLNTMNYFDYMFYLIPPVLSMMLVTSTVIKEDVENVEAAYDNTIRFTFTLLTLFFGFRLLSAFNVNDSLDIPRIIACILSIAYAITKRKVFFYIMFLLWLIGVVIRVKVLYF